VLDCEEIGSRQQKAPSLRRRGLGEVSHASRIAPRKSTLTGHRWGKHKSCCAHRASYGHAGLMDFDKLISIEHYEGVAVESRDVIPRYAQTRKPFGHPKSLAAAPRISADRPSQEAASRHSKSSASAQRISDEVTSVSHSVRLQKARFCLPGNKSARFISPALECSAPNAR
jgi:hypothetical protein